ncbi:MAG: dihydrolipoyl dehydrogenase [Rhizomicrobium sp.]
MKTGITIPDIGDFKDVPVIEILVAPGARVDINTPLLVLESDKATLEVPSPAAGTITEISVRKGDKVSQGTLVMTLQTVHDAVATVSAASPAPNAAPDADLHAEILVVGGGPGGYTAAFRAADLGHKVVLVERRQTLGGVCLNVGCIPSKALLHAAKVIDEAKEFSAHGIAFGEPAIDLAALQKWKDGVVGRLTSGLSGLARKRNVTVVTGEAMFVTPHSVKVSAGGDVKTIGFDQAIIAAGSEPATLPFLPKDDPRIIDSTAALSVASVPDRLLVIGGGIIGLEMATVYHALGAKVTVVEATDQLIPGADADIVAPLMKRISKKYERVALNTKVVSVFPDEKGIAVRIAGPAGEETAVFDQVLCAVGRKPNGAGIGAEAAGVKIDVHGFIAVDETMRTNIPHIFAVGDVVGQPMLAHKATHQAKIAAEVAAGQNAAFAPRAIPSVAYTDPEIAWVGVTETKAKALGIDYGKGMFPWAASGRALSLARSEGLTKILFDPATHRIIGAGMVGPNAGELIAEAALAIEMGADATDIGLTVHPHPTLSETFAFAAEAFEGTLTDL